MVAIRFVSTNELHLAAILNFITHAFNTCRVILGCNIKYGLNARGTDQVVIYVMTYFRNCIMSNNNNLQRDYKNTDGM